MSVNASAEIESSATLLVNFWGKRGRPELLSVRFLDIANQLLGDLWYVSDTPEKHNQESLSMAFNAIVNSATEGAYEVISSRDDYVQVALDKVAEACLMSGMVESERPDWAASVAVGVDFDD